MSIDSVRENWERLARSDPLWAILAADERRGNRWSVEEFFATGRDDIELWIARLAEAGVRLPGGRALDFGCGVGRLSRALAPHFERVVGVDVSRSMIDLGRRLGPPANVEFVVNSRADLSRFATGEFDFVLSLLVLQHLPRRLIRSYLLEFARVLRPGGVLVVELPGARTSLPAAAYQAGIELLEAPALSAQRPARLRLRVSNRSGAGWPGPPAHQLMVGNHWLRGEEVLSWDDGRAALPPLPRGESMELDLEVRPPRPGRLQLVVDVVAESVAWFAERGSTPLRLEVEVAGAETDTAGSEQPAGTDGEPVLEGHWLPVPEVRSCLAAGGLVTARVLHRPVIAFDDCYYIAHKPQSLLTRSLLRVAGWPALAMIRAARIPSVARRRLGSLRRRLAEVQPLARTGFTTK